MKKVYTIFAVTLSIMTCIKAYSQNGFSVFNDKGIIDLFSIHQIDSITFDEGQEFFIQKIWKDGEPFETSVNEVAEVSFLPKGNVYVFDDKTLGNWDGGFLIDSMYVSYKVDEENGGYYYFNNINADNNKGLIIQFDSENKMSGILCNGLSYSISEDENQLLLLGIDDEGVFEESINLYEVSSVRKARKRASSESIPLFDNLLTVKDYWGYIQTALNLGDDFRNRQWIDFFSTIGSAAGEYGISKMLEGAVGRLAFLAMAPYEMVKGSVEQCNKRNAAKIYGESSVEITEIRKSSDGRIEVYVTVNGVNTIPDYLVRLIEPEKNEKTKNNVYCGVIGRSAGLPTLQLHTKGYKSTEEAIPTDGSVSTLYFTFFLPDVPLGQTYRFRPYLKSTRIKNIWGGVDECFIRYGNSVAYTGFNGQITNFWQYRDEYGIDAGGFGFVSFGTEVTAEISSLENVEEWGVYVYDLNGSEVNDRYPSEFRAAKLTDKIDIDFNINMDEFDEVNQNIYTKKVMLGVYLKMKNPTGTYDYLSYYYSEPQEYELVYEDKNHLMPIVTTKITKFEQNSATFTRDGFEYKGKTYYYDFAATTTVELENSEGVVDWGYVYIDPYGEADTISVAGLGGNPANDPRYHYYRGIPNATATLYGYSKYADGTFVFDEPKDYDLVYTFHPTAYVGDIITDSLTSTSAQFEYGFNDVPRTGKCYTAVQSARDNEPIVQEVSYAEKDTKRFADLFPGTTYEYWAYVEYAGVTYTSDKKSLTTLTPTAHVEKAGEDKVTMTSAEIGYGFTNVPEKAKCYVGISAKVQTIAGDGEEISKSYSQTFSVENTTGATYEFNGLHPSTTYTYYAYVEYQGETWYSDSEKFTTKAPPTPIATTGDCSKVTTNSATVSCSFENVPEGGVCGVEYTWSNGSKKQSIGNANGTQTITLSGLESGTAYSYCAYVEAYGQTYYGGEKTFTTQVELPNLAGTWSCTVYKDDGSVLDTPTLTLTSDGKATIKNSSFTSEDKVGGWSINANGKASISFNWASSGYNPVYFQEAYSGTVNSMTNPSSIEGTVSRMWAGLSEHGNSYKFKMTR